MVKGTLIVQTTVSTHDVPINTNEYGTVNDFFSAITSKRFFTIIDQKETTSFNLEHIISITFKEGDGR